AGPIPARHQGAADGRASGRPGRLELDRRDPQEARAQGTACEDRGAGPVEVSRRQDPAARLVASMMPDSILQPPEASPMANGKQSASGGEIGAWEMFLYRFSKWLRSPRPYRMLLGFVLFFGAWFLLSEVFKVWRFASLPGPRQVPFGLFLGWSRGFREFTFPVFETLRPIAVLAWVPLAIVMFRADETPVIFLTTLASFYATALNTMLGVRSIDESYPRAAACLGASKWQIFRHIVVPGALPYIFTGLQISVGVAWFSLVAAEMVSGEYGLGYLINSSYVNVQYVVIFIGMISVGIVGYLSSALVRIAGDYMMQWRVRELALGGAR